MKQSDAMYRVAEIGDEPSNIGNRGFEEDMVYPDAPTFIHGGF